MYHERLLIDHLERLDGKCDGRWAVHVHLSKLRTRNRQPHHLRVAESTFEQQVSSYEGQFFALSNGDLVFVWQARGLSDLEPAVEKLRGMFGQDPLVQTKDESGKDGLTTWYNLADEHQAFADTAFALLDACLAQKSEEDVQDPAGRQSQQRDIDQKRPMTPDQLGRLEQAIGSADLSNLMRRQPVCLIAQDNPPRPVFRELFISIGELANSLLPEVDLVANRWLFQHLTQFLDRRMLALLTRKDDRSLASSFSLNLNVATLLSEEFEAFDRGLGQENRSTVVIELRLEDLIADLDAYLFAKDILHDRGYRLCLDGVTTRTLPLVDRDQLSLDLIKLFWSSDMLEESEETTKALAKRIAGIGRARTILARCDDADAIQFGRSVGISLFQGRHLDEMLSLSAPVEKAS
ncbi:MAG: hypothetical protein QNJ92_12240 [Alphaproteobacteria bacterium]|nr:hypothetical protein [Alphaproteobacteria bacterium]